MRVTGAPQIPADDDVAAFWVPDPGHRLAGVRLRPDVPVDGGQPDFRPSGDGWRLSVGRPPVSRMEYLVELSYPGGGSQTVTDPGNPRQVPGAFGPKSVLEFGSYTQPGWLTAAAVPGRTAAFDLPSPALGAAIPVITWAPPGVPDDEPLPLVVVHDGPEYDALAMLHAHCRHPDCFGALFLQSGSFFRPDYDSHERRFGYYQRIVSFVASLPGGLPGRPVPVTMTCGTIEENLPNNRSMAQVLATAGYPAALHEVPDAHNYTAWRDAFHPYLTRLLGQVCR